MIINYIFPLLVILVALLLLALTWSLSGAWLQADWCLAVLTSSLLAHRGNWPWVLPSIALHDIILFDSPWATFPFAAATPFLLARFDAQLGAALPQRVFLLLFVCAPLLLWTSSISIYVLTVFSALPCWYAFVRHYGRL